MNSVSTAFITVYMQSIDHLYKKVLYYKMSDSVLSKNWILRDFKSLHYLGSETSISKDCKQTLSHNVTLCNGCLQKEIKEVRKSQGKKNMKLDILTDFFSAEIGINDFFPLEGQNWNIMFVTSKKQILLYCDIKMQNDTRESFFLNWLTFCINDNSLCSAQILKQYVKLPI